MSGVVFENCGGGYGGAIYNRGNLNLHACQFDNNTAGDNGGAIDNDSLLTISNCTFSGNYASALGGAIASDGTVNAYQCSFSFNSAPTGGAIYNDGVLWVLSNYNEFYSNKTSQGAGGAIYNDGYATIVNADFEFNTSAASGGAIANFGNINASDNITFYRNHANIDGGGFYNGTTGSWSVYGTWTGNTAGVQGPNYYTPSGHW